MVTDEERDYMWGEYAKDPRAQLNLGIRRRLAPLLNNGRRQIELFYGLLLSLPGSPILYYGDEIGMGDNVYLGDRDGVRTPMQWNADRNGGFSRADFAQLYLPPLMDPVYGYQASTSRRSSAAKRRSCTGCGASSRCASVVRSSARGRSRRSMPRTLRSSHSCAASMDRLVLCVNNLSRFAQPVELDLRRYADKTPVEMLGRVHFPRIGELPYLLTMGPHGFYWFTLDPPASMSVDQGGAAAILRDHGLAGCEAALGAYVAKQRWAGAQGRTVEATRVVDAAVIRERAPLLLHTLTAVTYTDGHTTRYALPLGVRDVGDPIAERVPEFMIPWPEAPAAMTLYDAVGNSTYIDWLLDAIREQRVLETSSGELRSSCPIRQRSTPAISGRYATSEWSRATRLSRSATRSFSNISAAWRPGRRGSSRWPTRSRRRGSNTSRRCLVACCGRRPASRPRRWRSCSASSTTAPRAGRSR